MQNKKFQIFISSTYEDLKKEREKVIATILSSYNFPIGMEMFNADNVEEWEQIRRTIDSSDYYVLIIKRRYGSLTRNEISYTEKEYNYAQKKGVPVLAFIAAENASIEAKDIENDPEKMIKLNSFIKRVKDKYPCRFWKNADELCTQVSQALQNQYETNERAGWIRNDGTQPAGDFNKLNEETLIKIREKIDHEIIRKNGNLRLVYDFIDDINEKIIWNIRKQTYIDTLSRDIVLEVQGTNLKVSITSRINYLNVKEGIPYFSTNPRFETKEQAESYRIEEYSVNGQDLLESVTSSVEFTEKEVKGRQFPYRIQNTIPLVYNDNIYGNEMRIVFKTSHVVPISQFFHVYQLVFPCRSFQASIVIKGDANNSWRVRTGTFSSFNVHTYAKYTPEYRKDDVSTVTIGKWSLPGSGYTVVLQRSNQ